MYSKALTGCNPILPLNSFELKASSELSNSILKSKIPLSSLMLASPVFRYRLSWHRQAEAEGHMSPVGCKVDADLNGGDHEL